MVPLGEKSWGKLAGAVFVWCFSPLSEFSGMPETHLENGMMEHVSGFLNFSLLLKRVETTTFCCFYNNSMYIY